MSLQPGLKKPSELFLSCLAVAARNVSVVSHCEFSDDRADFDRSGKEAGIDSETKSLRLCCRGMTSQTI